MMREVTNELIVEGGEAKERLNFLLVGRSWPYLPSCGTQSHQGTLPWSSQIHIYLVSGRACVSSGVLGLGG